MSLWGFKYLRSNRLITLFLMLTLLSMLFSVTAISSLSFYKSLVNYLGEEEDIVVLYDRNARTPFSGYVPVHLAERLENIKGVIVSSPEVIAPSIVKGEAVFVRGVLPKKFFELHRIKILNGSIFDQNETKSAIIGKNIARRLNLKLNDRLFAFGVLTESYVELQVRGIYASDSFIDDEILVPLYVGQWLRGINYGYVSFIRFKVNKSLINLSEVFSEVMKEGSEHSSHESRLRVELVMSEAVTNFSNKKVGAEIASRLMRSYIDRYGLTEETILILSTAIILFSSAMIAVASETTVTQHKGEIGVLRALGASKKFLKLDIIIKILTLSLFSSLLGTLLAIIFLSFIQVQERLVILSHIMRLQLDLTLIVMSILITPVLVLISLFKIEIK
ncbi:MAG: FtsX-like permease family protein [Candidatus Korarchaeum sp.]